MTNLEEGIKIIKKGGVVIFPTDTAFGIGCRMDDARAVSKVFEIRNRPKEMAVPVLFDSIERVKEYALPIPKEVQEGLMDKYWPGALTIVIPARTEKIPSIVRAGGDTLGFRIPDHFIPLSIINALGVPIIAPSANFHSELTPYRLEELNKELIEKVDFVIEGETKGNNVSTVVDCVSEKWVVLRQGGVKIDET